MFSAATDGKIVVWNLTEASSSADVSSDAPAPPIPCLSIPAHQSGVNSLAVWAEKLGQQEGSCLVTVASGGDDGQLTVSMISVQFPDDGRISETPVSLHTQSQPPNQFELHLHAQSHIPLAHAAPLTALKFLSPGLVVSTSSDQRVCLWKICSTGISHKGTLCSHVADAAGLAVWEVQMTEVEDGEKKGKTGFERLESKQENDIWRVKGSQTELETEGETGRKFSKNKETVDEAKGGEPVEVASETDDPVCKTSDEKGDERAGEYRNQTETDSVCKTEREVNPEKGLKACESRKKGEKTGWVLVCGQGFQLLRVRNVEEKS